MEQSQKLVSELVEDFKANEHAYLSPSYQESQVRQDFIDKFFSALGWDVTHNIQKNPYQQEVKIENKVTVGSSQKRADYAFSIAPNYEQVKFFVEAKKPSRSLANPDDYFQTIRYAWNTKTPISVLTDFEEFHILDCRHKPKIDDALNRKIESFHYSDYTKEEIFAKIYHLFARDAVLSGSLDQFISQLQKRIGKNPANYQPVDDAFLEELDEYRVTLAKAFKKTNERLQGEELTEAVQRTIDRLVFIRFLEDKGIEDRQIVKLANQKSPWQAFVALCKRLDPKYNGLVFKPHRILDSGEFNSPDEKPFAQICRELSDPASPYDFNQIPVSILGSIYERFLGKVVHATDKRVKVEEKPEVRKAGGVYYTPEYIVRYIVKETIGKVIEGKSPKEISKMAFADIACGSGSFLIEVYQQLVDYHIRFYNAHPDEATDENTFNRNGMLQLTLKLKKEILVNNIYGIDIDYQATEVTQMSLYLKMLEQATMQDAHQFGMFKEQILPDLRKNIVCGNSLVGTDINGLFAFDSVKGLRPLDYEDVFPNVIRKGGFDAIVGNPPYIKIQEMSETNIDLPIYLKKNYKSAQSGNFDIYVAFVERGNTLLRSGGGLGYILPHKFFNSGYGRGLRSVLTESKSIEKVIHFGDQQIFKGATTYTCLLFLKKNPNEYISISKIGTDRTPEEFLLDHTSYNINSNNWSAEDWNINDITSNTIIKKVMQYPKLEELTTNIFQGPKAGADDVFILKPISVGKTKSICYSSVLGSEVELENDVLSKYIKGKYIKRFGIQEKFMEVTIFPYDNNKKLISRELLQSKYPLAWEYFNESAIKKILLAREHGRYAKQWWAYSRPQNMHILDRKKILTPFNAFSCSFALDTKGDFIFSAGVSGAYGILMKPEIELPYEYVLAILNSKLTFYIIKNISTSLRGGYWSFENKYLQKLPIKPFDALDSCAKLIRLSMNLMQTKEEMACISTDAEMTRLELRVYGLDRQIDEAVYALYGLTEEEIRMIEDNEH